MAPASPESGGARTAGGTALAPPRTREGLTLSWRMGAPPKAGDARRAQRKADQASASSSGEGPSFSRMRSAIRPAFSRIARSIRSAVSGLAFRKALAFSRP
jgi:hypothetical protein